MKRRNKNEENSNEEVVYEFILGGCMCVMLEIRMFS